MRRIKLGIVADEFIIQPKPGLTITRQGLWPRCITALGDLIYEIDSKCKWKSRLR